MIIEQLASGFTKYHLNHPAAPDPLPWYVHPVIHRFTEPDVGLPHDHPWAFQSLIISGGYVEEIYNADGWHVRTVERQPGDVIRNDATHIHRIIHLIGGECITFVLAGTDAGFPDVPERTWRYWRLHDGRVQYREHNSDYWKGI